MMPRLLLLLLHREEPRATEWRRVRRGGWLQLPWNAPPSSYPTCSSSRGMHSLLLQKVRLNVRRQGVKGGHAKRRPRQESQVRRPLLLLRLRLRLLMLPRMRERWVSEAGARYTRMPERVYPAP